MSGSAKRADQPHEERGERRLKRRSTCVLRRGCSSSAAIAVTVRNIVLPREAVADDCRVNPNGLFRAPIALRKPPAELVHGRIGIDPYRVCVLANVCTSKNSGRPGGDVVALETGPQFHGYFRGVGDLLERNASLEADAAEVGSVGVPGHPPGIVARTPPRPAVPRRRQFGGAGPGTCRYSTADYDFYTGCRCGNATRRLPLVPLSSTNRGGPRLSGYRVRRRLSQGRLGRERARLPGAAPAGPVRCGAPVLPASAARRR